MARIPVAPHFYSGDCAAQIDAFLAGFEPPAEPPEPLAGIVPHAGWLYSGAPAAKVIRCLGARSPEAFVIFGAVHSWSAADGGVYAAGAWATPLGDVEIDADLASMLLERCSVNLTGDDASHAQEHSIEVQVPMIRYLCPGARIVPIAMPPTPNAAAAGTAVGSALADSGRNVAVLGSSDLTHYGASYGFVPWGTGADAREKMRASDRRIIDLALGFEADQIVPEANEHSNACGAGAIAATVAAARSMGAGQGGLVEYTTSHDVMGEPPDAFRMAVGYAGIVLGK